jgi:hypothetical protein
VSGGDGGSVTYKPYKKDNSWAYIDSFKKMDGFSVVHIGYHPFVLAAFS